MGIIDLGIGYALFPGVITILKRRVKPMDIVRYRPFLHELPVAFDRLAKMREEFDRVFNTSFEPLFGSSFSRWNPALDLYQDKDQFTVVAELPGMKKEEIDISLRDGVLTISGERKREGSNDKDQGYVTERFFGKFQRSVTLPVAVDANKVKATYKDGILQITLPKAEEAKARHIELN
jgi:HSP20 family protein